MSKYGIVLILKTQCCKWAEQVTIIYFILLWYRTQSTG